jgi:hypothetical protein
MKPVDRQKICSNCDGRIPINAKECIYCGAEQPEQSETPLFKQQTLQDSLSSLYAPIYNTKNQNQFEREQEKEPSIKATATTFIAEEEAEEHVKHHFLPIFLLIIGTNLFTIGLLQLFFSTNGLLSLEWNSSYWFFYCLSAIPMCYFGYKKAI